MTRFARIKNSKNKPSFNKVAEQASTWNELKPENDIERHEAEGNLDDEDEDHQARPAARQPISSVWSDLLDVKEENSRVNNGLVEMEWLDDQNTQKRLERQSVVLAEDGDEVPMAWIDGVLLPEDDVKSLRNLRRSLEDQGGMSKAEINARVKAARRKAEKFLARKKKKVCFECRQRGHNVADCPNRKKSTEAGDGICYKCGSTEHSLAHCRTPGSELKFATCFICRELGHLSAACPDNPRGLYPDGGGCRHCGQVTHLQRDCPEALNSKRKGRDGWASRVTVTVRGKHERYVDDLDEDNDREGKRPRAGVEKKRCKIVKF